MATPTTAGSPPLPPPDIWAPPRPVRWLPVCLLLVSLFTTASTGALLMHNFQLNQPPLVNEGDLIPLLWSWRHLGALGSGWSFSLALLSILLAHEGGHYFFCRRHGIVASWPYVLPAPTLSGTAGAVIRIRSRIPSRRALIEVGIAGPIAGYVVAIPVAIAGLLLSRPADSVTGSALVMFRQPWTIALLDRWLRLPRLDRLLPHPILIAAWVGFFVTSLNLIPAGQLDGGHILYAVSPIWHRRMSRIVPVILLLMGLTMWTGWVLWGVILFLPAMRHPMVPNYPRLPRMHRWLCVLALVLLLLTFLPAPFVGVSVLDMFR